jgi:putative solute:sodium symporter small subunit
MTDIDSHTDSGDESLAPDGGTTQAAQQHRETNYLDREVNILKPSTAFMRDHLRIVWTGFIVWALIVFGPVTATAVAPEAMQMIIPGLGFPLHYFLVAFGAPTGALVLAAVYARQRDKLDQKYGIDHSQTGAGMDDEDATGETAAADGGVAE